MPQLAKRYFCEVCKTQVVCMKPGDGKLVCCGKEMQIQEPKPVPSSD